MPDETQTPNANRRQTRRGFLNPRVVTSVSFWTTSACIVVAVVSCLLAIWNFAGTDVLWRTVATCAVVGGAWWPSTSSTQFSIGPWNVQKPDRKEGQVWVAVPRGLRGLWPQLPSITIGLSEPLL